jgi:hypothetical protein
MKKAAVIVILFMCLSLASCSGGSNTNKAIEELNQNCDVPFGLTLPESSLQNTAGYIRYEGFGGYLLENDDVSFSMGGYPDVLDKYHVVEYQIKSSKYTLMGLQIGCSLDSADEVMEQNGYTVSADDNWWSRYTKSGVRVGIELNGDIITRFHVSVQVTNKENVVF